MSYYNKVFWGTIVPLSVVIAVLVVSVLGIRAPWSWVLCFALGFPLGAFADRVATRANNRRLARKYGLYLER